ncbi:hypothetical protein COEREDRAFT_10876 [Coemansia reversa NRRL 1564]|uniref:RNA polymerase II-associated n=1 Tax=Coemansia reversa (strain ATCC 12441 / NRRL 1564) TaxID=763665 RepID=A0A2G5B4J6_COERN|nr:hypothetical protein COEREDRAFT_10876 [Coemansia reversa NRRL 1564]|eukprot:PIA13938.1 hypothetical protein COEREDRAFT_10876 [Coemansia reversa NRRL 1564]
MAHLSSKNTKKGVGKEFLCRVRYQNPLPPVPFPPKLLPIPPTYVDPDAGSYSQARLQHYVEYRHTTLEEATPYPMFVDADCGMPIDPCFLGTFDEDAGTARPKVHQLDKEDEFLLNLPSAVGGDTSGFTPEVNGSNTPGAHTPGGASTPRTTAPPRTSSSVKRVFDHSLRGQLQAIEESFQFFAQYDERPEGERDLLRDLRHPTNSTLHAVEAVPLLPDEQLWPNMYTVFSVDVCPEPEYITEKMATLDIEERRNLGDKARESLIFRPRVRRNNIGEDEQWIECFLPENEDTAARFHRRLEESAPANEDDQTIEYRFEKSREYDVPVRPATHRQDLYMISTAAGNTGEAEAKYVPVKSRVLLKRRNPPTAAHYREMLDDPLHITSLDLQLRDFSEDEIQERAAAMGKLHNVVKEEVLHTSTARIEEDEESVDVGGDLFHSDDDALAPNRHRAPSYSPSP